MISRHWTCVTHPASAADYERHLRSETFKAIEKIDGFRSADGRRAG